MGILSDFLAVVSWARDLYGQCALTTAARSANGAHAARPPATVESAAATRIWSGNAASGYNTSKIDQKWRLEQVARQHIQAATQIHDSASDVAAGRKSLKAVGDRVLRLAEMVPATPAGHDILAQTVQGGLADIGAIVRGTHAKLEAAGKRLDAMTNRLRSIADHPKPGHIYDDQDPNATRVEQTPGGHVHVTTGDDDDRVTVNTDWTRGKIIITVNGATWRFTAVDNTEVTITTHGGDDIVEMGNGIPVNVKVNTGAGHDWVKGGSGREYINGSTGNDRIEGGGGNDVLYGGDDNDYIHGGGDDDYIEGGAGDDEVIGGNGNDIVSGGAGDDRIVGEGGKDKLYTGSGTDRVWSDGHDTVYAQIGEDTIRRANGDTVLNVELKDLPDTIQVQGSPAFRERALADLEFFRSGPTGQAMLDGLSEGKPHTITVVESNDSQNRTMWYGDGDWRKDAAVLRPDGQPGPGTDATIRYATDRIVEWGHELMPAVALFHEAAHACDVTNGTMRVDSYNGVGVDDIDDGVQNGERAAVGLPIDHDNRAETPDRLAPEHPEPATERALLRELERPLRTSYRLLPPG